MAQSTRSVLFPVLSSLTAVFSDIDGTLAHYAKTLGKLGYEKLDAPPVSWREDDARHYDEIDELLLKCYPLSARSERFASIPCQYWRHVESGRVVKTYELYNLSLTGAVISENTILLMELLQRSDYLFRGLDVSQVKRSKNPATWAPVVCCLITGARTSTFTRRRHGGSLPQTVFESCEGGSKLWCRLKNPSKWFKDQAGDSTAEDVGEGDAVFYLPESDRVPMDAQWTDGFAGVTGFRAHNTPEQNARLRQLHQTLWSLEAELNAAGFATDHEHYDTSFLIDIRNSPCVKTSPSYALSTAQTYPALFADADAAEKHVVAKFRDVYNEQYGVELFVNLGKGQVNARGSGKRGVMQYVLRKAAEMDAAANEEDDGGKKYDVANSVALFDDENDLQFAELCGAGILPSVAHDEVLRHEQWNCDSAKRRWFRPPIEGLLGSEWALKQIVLFKREKGFACEQEQNQ